MSDLTEKELLEGLDVMRADSIAHWNDEFAKDAWTDEKRQKETRGIKQAYAQLRKIVEGHFREPMRADEEKIRFDIPKCHHAYKMLDRAENLWCDDCVIRAIDTVAEQLLTQKRTVTRASVNYDARKIVEEVFKKEYTENNSQTLNIIIEMLEELGIEVENE